jgi:hypothetical protein
VDRVVQERVEVGDAVGLVDDGAGAGPEVPDAPHRIGARRRGGVVLEVHVALGTVDGRHVAAPGDRLDLLGPQAHEDRRSVRGGAGADAHVDQGVEDRAPPGLDVAADGLEALL